MNSIDDMLRNPRFTLDSLSDAQIAMLHGKTVRAWHKSCAVFAEIDVTDSQAFAAMSGVLSELASLQSDTSMQMEARSKRFAADMPAEFACCGNWVGYPAPGHDAECPTCHSVFTVKS